MKRFFAANLEVRGRWLRGALGAVLVVGGMLLRDFNLWLAIALILSGGFCWFEAVRGWCVMRACGVKTRF
jgi:hypothetical protein